MVNENSTLSYMKNQYKHYLGVDVSKKTLDLALVTQGDLSTMEHCQVDNTIQGIRKLTGWLKGRGVAWSDLLVCMEYTGIYNRPLVNHLLKEAIALWLELPISIKRSLGLQRGKSDKLDAMRIAEYAVRFYDKARLWQPSSQSLLRLKDLLALRQRLNKCVQMLRAPIRELKAIGEKSSAAALERHCKEPLRKLEKEQKRVEETLRELIGKDRSLNGNYKLLQTVPGIGPVAAIELIASTNNFLHYDNPKQLACYAGCAPFPNSSGTSLQGRRRVSKMANMRLKTVLTLGVWSQIKRKAGTISTYYQRKIQQGKAPYQAINAARNKILHLALAVVRTQQPYDPNYQNRCAA